MKKIGMMMCGLALMAAAFVSCDKKKDPIAPTIPNGFYVAIAGAELEEANAMDQGINEVGQTERAGMYEKYIVLTADQEYEFVHKKGHNFDHFGADLAYSTDMIITDNHEIAGYKASLAENTTFKVNETGLYHIVLDFDEDGSLSDVGGPQCIIVPVEWGIRGAMNSWGFTAGVVDGNKVVWDEVICESAGGFKFAHNDCWKIHLDIANLVKANTNLGMDLLPGGGDITIDRAVYHIELEFVGPAVTTQESFKMVFEKIRDLEEQDPSEFVYSFIGTVNGKWDTDTDLAFVDEDNGHYVFSGEVSLSAGDFKIRRDHDWAVGFGFGAMTIDGAEVSEAASDGNVALANGYEGTVTFEFDWSGSAETNVTLTFGEYTPIVKYHVTFIVNDETKSHTNMYAWSDSKGLVFGAWPGVALDGTLEADVPAAEDYHVILNGGDPQTADSPAFTISEDCTVVVSVDADNNISAAVEPLH